MPQYQSGGRPLVERLVAQRHRRPPQAPRNEVRLHREHGRPVGEARPLVVARVRRQRDGAGDAQQPGEALGAGALRGDQVGEAVHIRFGETAPE